MFYKKGKLIFKHYIKYIHYRFTENKKLMNFRTHNFIPCEKRLRESE